MKRKKILILPSWYPKNKSDTTAQYIVSQVQAVKKIHDVTVFDCSFNFPLIPHSIRILSKALLALPIAFQNDILHAHIGFPAGLIGIILHKITRKPLIITEHTGPVSDLLPYFIKKNGLNKLYNQANKIITVSHFQKNEVEKICGRKDILVIGNIVHDDFFSANINSNSNENRLCAIPTRLTKEKGIPELIEALKIYESIDAPKFKLDIIGDGPLFNELDKISKHLKKTEIQIIKSRGRKTVIDMILQSKGLLLTSKLETFSLVAAEALALGRPVLGFDSGGPADFVVEPYGKLTKSTHPKDLAQCILNLLTKQEWQMNEKNCQKRRDHIKKLYSEAAILNELSKVYYSVG